MNRISLAAAFALGLISVLWVGVGFVGSNWSALAMTIVIGAVYLVGALEIKRFRAVTSSLASTLANIPDPLSNIGDWLGSLHPSLHTSVRRRIEGERAALPSLALTPYLVGLLVMLGMLGTFLGMVVTFKGAVFALEGSADLQAVRSALAAPIQGLGLAFGTSVAGVASSAMLGLMSAICRRERMDASRQLDIRISTVLRPFSHVHQREETFKALQLQAHALPDVADKLQALIEQLERRSQQQDERLLARQADFHRNVTVAYTDLARAVEQSLKDTLMQSARLAGESIKPVVESAMTAIAEDSRRMHERVRDAVQAQLDGLAGQFSVSTNAMAATLHKQWQQVGEQTLARQLATCETLERTASKVTEHASHQAERTIAEIARLLNRSEELVRSRTEAEASLTQQHGERMDQLSTLWRTELAKLRQDEAGRGQAAVDRLDELQAAVASHLATLGAALETPLNRLLHTASEVPRAAAEVIAQLRLEMSHLTERDNLALQERVVLGEKVSTLLQTVHQSADAQRAAIESLVASAAEVLDKASRQFSQELGAQSTRTQEVAAQVTGSAIELSSLGEAFNHGVQLFTASNEKLMESLQRIEGAAQQSLARSDEQLAYYVAQAREVIDLSISSQQGIIEDLRRLHTGQQAMAQEVAG